MFQVRYPLVQLRKTIFAPSFFRRNIKLRLLSTNSNLGSSTTNFKPKSLADELPDFMAVLPDVKHELIDYAKTYDSKNVTTWFEKVLDYNLALDQKFRGLSTSFTFKHIVDGSKLTPHSVRSAQFIGWCIELLHAYFLILDDIVNQNTFQRGQKCWHCVDGVGMIAITDALMLEGAVYPIIQKHFHDTDYCVQLIQLFQDTVFATVAGQALNGNRVNSDVTKFSMEMHRVMTLNKITRYTFYLPVAAAMVQAGIKNEKIFHEAEKILMEIGHLKQVQDDVKDCFDDVMLSGKYGTDIEENKCSWLAIQCMQRASEEQKDIMKRCYGEKDVKKVAEVKRIYKDLDLLQYFLEYEKETYKKLQLSIEKNAGIIPQEIFFGIIDDVMEKTQIFKK